MAKRLHRYGLLAELYCPFCRTPHIDRDGWALRPHCRHLCAGCGRVWREEGSAAIGASEDLIRSLNSSAKAIAILVTSEGPWSQAEQAQLWRLEDRHRALIEGTYLE